MVVSIQFCGGCNPHIDRGSIAHRLKEKLLESRHEVLINSPIADMTIFLSGCPSGCAFVFNTKDPPFIVVAAETVDGAKVSQEDI